MSNWEIKAVLGAATATLSPFVIRHSELLAKPLPAHRVMPHANKTTESELSGMSTAQMSGERIPQAAMLIPMRL